MAEYIKREAVMQKFADHVERSNNSDFAPVPTWNQAVQIVEDFPAADVVERKHGKWVEDEDGCVCCSLCLNPCEINGITGEFLYSPYCSECGADMRGDDDGI